MDNLEQQSEQKKQESEKKLTKNRNKTILFYGPLVICGILSIPVISIFNGISDNKKAKKHPNVIKEVSSDYFFMQDVHDNEERVVSKKVMRKDSADADYLHAGDTVYFYDCDYDRRITFEYGTLIYNKDTIQKRKDREKINQILNQQKPQHVR